MKKPTVLLSVVMLALAGFAAHAQQTKPADKEKMEKSAKPAATHKASGVVKKADPGKGSVMLAHEPVKSLGWPAMTMAFAVRDKALFDKLQAGRKIEFEFVQQGNDHVITAVK